MYQVHRQAMAIDRGQLVLARTMVVTYCNKTGIAPVTGGSCSNKGGTPQTAWLPCCSLGASRVTGGNPVSPACPHRPPAFASLLSYPLDHNILLWAIGHGEPRSLYSLQKGVICHTHHVCLPHHSLRGQHGHSHGSDTRQPAADGGVPPGRVPGLREAHPACGRRVQSVDQARYQLHGEDV